MFVSVILFLIVISYYIFSWLWQKILRNKKSTRIPPMFPGDLPAIGHAHLLLGNTIQLWQLTQKVGNSATDNGGVITFCLGPWKIYALTDPEDCHLVGNLCLEKDVVYDVAKPWLGEGLVTAPVSIWRRHRKLLNPAFSQTVLDGYMTVFNAQSKILVQNLEEQVGKGVFNHDTYIQRMALEIICLTAMGINDKEDVLKNTLFMEAVNDMFHTIMQRIQTVWMHSNILFKLSTLGRKHDKLVKILHDMSDEILRKRMSVTFDPKKSEKINGNTPKRLKAFLDLLLQTSVDGSLTEKEIREEVDTMISAGYDTSSTLLTSALVLIGSYPEVQEKMYEELHAVFEGSDRDVTKYDLPKLVYMEAVLKETLRLYPVVPIVARLLDRDVELKNYSLSAGQSCFIMIHGIHTHPVWGPDRLQFRPERWLNPAELPDINTAFAGFGIGKRSCIGQRFALMSAKTTLSNVLRRYRVTGDHTKMVLKFDIMLKPAYHHHISIERR